MKGTARHYQPLPSTGIDLYEDHNLIVERDGDEIVRVETTPTKQIEDAAWGSPGISLELSPDDAVTLAVRLLKAADPNIFGRIVEGLDYKAEDMAERANFEEKIDDPGDEAKDYHGEADDNSNLAADLRARIEA